MASPDFNTSARIIRFAMENAGLLASGDDPSPEQFAKYTNRLNDLINLWQTRGIKLWLNSLLPVTLVAGTGTYTLDGQPKRVLEAYYKDDSTPPIMRPLNPLSWNTYNNLASQEQQGSVNSYFVDKQQGATVLHLWQVPDLVAATGTVQCLVQNKVTNIITLTDNMNFPNEWYMALHWGLAAEICTGQPEQIVQRCERRSMEYLTALEDWDVEDAPVTFQPNMTQRRQSSFR